MPLFNIAPVPESNLARYRLLSTTAGVRVSPLALGGGNIGSTWHAIGAGAMDKEGSFKLLDGYFDLGGNFIDTANLYQDETSEQFIGEWAEKRGIRDQLFIATKYTFDARTNDPSLAQHIQFGGNNVKSMHISIERSLKNLRTTYVDLFYAHYWDHETSIAEVMRGLHMLVQQRKVLYLGISDTPAWVVAKANQYARDHGLTPFSVYQGKWGILDRSFERDIIPMARDEGMALAPWEVLGGGKIRTDAEEERRRVTGEKGRQFFGPDWERTEQEKKVSKALEEVAKEVGTEHITAVAIAYVLHKARFVFPIVGGRKLEHLKANIEALSISLSKDQIQRLESVVPFDLGFPHNMIGNGTDGVLFDNINGFVDKWPVAGVISGVKTGGAN